MLTNCSRPQMLGWSLSMKRKVLVILSNRWNPAQKAHYLEIECDEEGSVLRERKLRSLPAKSIYDEVWQNDEGKMDFAASHKFSRKYGHKLQKPKT